MRTAFIVLILGLAATSVMSACVANNWLAALVTLPANTFSTTAISSGGTAAVGGKCGWGSTTQICAADAAAESTIITAIQTYISAQRTKLQDEAGNKDKYLIEQRGKVIATLDTLRRLNELVDDAPVGAKVIAELFGGYGEEIAKNFTAIVENLETYQKSRAACIKDLLQVQAGIICGGFQSVTPFTTDPGTTAAAIPIIDATINTLTSTCFAYMDDSATQSAIIYTNLYSKILSAVVSLLENPSGSNVNTIITDFGKITLPSENYQLPSSLPTGCTSGTAAACRTFLETKYFDTGLLNQAVIINGADASQITFSRRLEGERRLATTGFAADLTKLSFDTTFEENPGSIDNKKNANSALRNGIVACAVAALALVF